MLNTNPTEPMAQLTTLLGEITKMPLGPERDKKWAEAYELFGPAAEELSLLRDTLGVLAERNQNGESLKEFMKQAGIDTPIIVRQTIKKQSKVVTFFKSGAESVRDYWDRKKGKIAVVTTFGLIAMFALNYRNVKLLDDFIHEEDLVGQFEDWAGMTNPEDEEDRETPLNWRELREDDNV